MAALDGPAPVREAAEAALRRVAEGARRILARRWPEARVSVVERPAVDAILGEARRRGARTIVVGSHGYGALGRLLLGSVSRTVVHGASCPVLVVRGRPRPVRHLVLGVDGSPNAQRAAAYVAELTPPPGGRVTLVRVVPREEISLRPPLPPAAMAIARSRVAVVNAERARVARRELEAVARLLRRAGWRVRPRVCLGAPVDALLATVRSARAQVLVVGARGVAGLRRLLLGSVAEGVLTHAPGPVLIVR
jgi:nucleotide-binding universal stress UspA family protein